MTAAERARELLTTACVRLKFPPPREGEGLARWADESLDSVLPPRGGEAWQAASVSVLDALEGAMHDDAERVERGIVAAVSAVQKEGRRACTCEAEIAAITLTDGRAICTRCHGRRRA